MATSNQQIFVDSVARFIASMSQNMPVWRGRSYAQAGLNFTYVAKSIYQHHLSSWCWRMMRSCELHEVTIAEMHEQHNVELLNMIGTLIRSNSNIQGGSLTSRVRRLVTQHAVNQAILEQLARNPATQLRIRQETPRAIQLVGELADDDSEPNSDEAFFSESEAAEDTNNEP